MQERYFTLVFIKNNKSILLGKKKRGFGKGLFNGFGGKLERNENMYECAIREVKEECNLDLRMQDLRYLGDVTYTESHEKRIVYIFTVTRYEGEIRESEEMAPAWFQINNMPLREMHLDFTLWYQLVLYDDVDVKFTIHFVGNTKKVG